jgi:adenosylcobinamide-phosphate synthase
MFPLTALLAVLGDRLFGYPPALARRIGHPVEWLGAMISALDRTLNRRAPTEPPAGCAARSPWRSSSSQASPSPCRWRCSCAPSPSASSSKRCSPSPSSPSATSPAPSQRRRRPRPEPRRRPRRGQPHRRARSGRTRRIGRRPRRHREPGRERLRRRRGAGAVSRAVRAAGHRRLQGRQYGRQHDRPPVEALPALRLGRGPPRRSPEPPRLAPHRPADRRRRRRPRGARTMWRDAGRHVSPNAGWPEAAMAGALAIRLGGPRSYHGRTLDLPWLGSGRKDLEPAISAAPWPFTPEC